MLASFWGIIVFLSLSFAEIFSNRANSFAQLRNHHGLINLIWPDQGLNRGGDLGLCLFFFKKIFEKMCLFTRFFGIFLKNWPHKNPFLDDSRGVSGIVFSWIQIFSKIDFYCIFRPLFFKKLPKVSKTTPPAPFSGALHPKNVSFFGAFGAQSVSFFWFGHPLGRSPPPYSIPWQGDDWPDIQ